VRAARRGVALALLVTSCSLFGSTGQASAAQPIVPRGVLIVLVPGVSFEQLLRHPTVRALAARGGAALMPARDDPRQTILDAFPHGGLHPLPTSGVDLRLTIVEQGFGPAPAPLDALDAQIGKLVARFDVGELLVAVVGDRPSAPMRATKDGLLPLVLATGQPGSLLDASSEPRSLTSESTRRAGVVVPADLPTTIVDFVGHPIPGNPAGRAHAGSVIRTLDEPAPFELHARYLTMRRMTVPVQTAAGVYVTLAGLFGIGLLALRRRAHHLPHLLVSIGAWLAMSVPALAVGLLAAGHLPTLSYATVVPFVVAVTVVGTLAFVPLARRDPLLAPAAIGWAVLAYFVVEAAAGWTAALTPFLGGSELDGGRFFGLPNVFIGLLVGASLFAAASLPTAAGTTLLVLVAFFAGLPFAGANLGGSITLFAAAGLWWAIRSRGRFDLRGLLVAAGVVVVGTALVLLSHRYLTSAPTHVTRFEETSARSPSGIWRTFADRMLVGWRLILRNPFALVPVLGLGTALLAVLRPPGSVRTSLERRPAWRDALLVTLLAGIVAIPVNDSWPAALGLAFGLGLGGLVYVSLIDGTWKMGTT